MTENLQTDRTLSQRPESKTARDPASRFVPLPDGRVAFAPGQGLGLKDLEGAVVLESKGPGFERVRAFTRKRLAVGLHEIPGDFPSPLGGFAAPPRQRLDVAGVLE